ncbi:retrovirus-related pol polyprotein from transposon TNT 1-94 [Tanacetum coccineum]
MDLENKMDENGVVIKNKARLVAQGYNQKISKEVYVQQPPGFESSEFPNHVCKLDKALNGLKQAPKHGFQRNLYFSKKYVKDLLKKYDLAYCALVKCPMLPPNNLGLDKLGVSVNETLYQANLKESHLVAVKRIIRYLKGTPNLGLWYPKGSGFYLKAYFDSDYVGCNLDRKSTSRGCQILGGKLVCWSAKKQSSVPMSSAEVEYVAAAGCYHILKGDIELHFVPTDLQLADVFTKPLAVLSFSRLVAELVALLEHSNDLYHPMLGFLSNCCISTALNIQPSTIYVEYLREFWYTTEVDETTKTITFSFLTFKKSMSFTQDEFISTIGLPIVKDVVPLPPKEIVRAGLATLGLIDKDKPTLSSTVLVNSSPLKLKYFTPT